MDRIMASEAVDPGSTPGGSTIRTAAAGCDYRMGCLH